MVKTNVNSLLRKFKKRTKRSLKKDTYTELFYINTNRNVIEFLSNDKGQLLVNEFFKEFLSINMKDFCALSLHSDTDEKIKNWYYDDENLVLKIEVLWGIKKHEILLEVDIDNFVISIINNDGLVLRNVDIELLKNYLINFITSQSKEISRISENIINREL